MAKYDAVDQGHRVTRWVRKRYLARDDNKAVIVDESGVPLFVAPQAFALRSNEDYLSVTQIDKFEGSLPERVAAGAELLRMSLRNGMLDSDDAFCVAICSEIHKKGSDNGRKLRIIEMPSGSNVMHVAIKNWPEDDYGFLESMSEEVFATRLLFGSLPAAI